MFCSQTREKLNYRFLFYFKLLISQHQQRRNIMSDWKHNVCGFLHSGMYYFLFLYSGNNTKRGVEFHHSKQELENWVVNWEAECLNTSFPLPTLLYAGYSVELTKNIFIKLK